MLRQMAVRLKTPSSGFGLGQSLEHQAWPGPFECKPYCNPYLPGSAVRPAPPLSSNIFNDVLIENYEKRIAAKAASPGNPSAK